MDTDETELAISVVMPVRDGLRYVERAVASVLAQSFTRLELLILDDGSEDGTSQLLDKLAAQDKRIRVFHFPKRGMRTVVNHGLSEARAPLIARMDADDICLPDRFQTQFDYLQTHPEIAAVGGSAWAIDDTDLPMFPIVSPTDWQTIQKRLLSGSNCFIHPAMMYRKAAVLEVGAYQDEYPTDDYGLWLRLAETHKLGNVPDYVLHYRISATEQNISKHQQQRAATQRILAEAYQRRGLGEPPSLPQDYSPLTIGRTYHHWAMSAAKHSCWRAARKHAIAAITREPTNFHAWWTLFKSIVRFRGFVNRGLRS